MSLLKYKATQTIPPEILANTPDVINLYSKHLIESVSYDIHKHIVKNISPSVVLNGGEYTINVNIDGTLIPMIKVDKSIINEISFNVIKDIRSASVVNNKPKRKRVICPETGRPTWKK